MKSVVIYLHKIVLYCILLNSMRKKSEKENGEKIVSFYPMMSCSTEQWELLATHRCSNPIIDTSLKPCAFSCWLWFSFWHHIKSPGFLVCLQCFHVVWSADLNDLSVMVEFTYSREFLSKDGNCFIKHIFSSFKPPNTVNY